MTRSVRKRMNANAQHVARHVAWAYGPNPLAYDAASVQHLADRGTHVDRERLAEVNWPYAAELLNRMTR